MQPCSREMQESQMTNSLHDRHHHQQLQSHPFDPTSSHDDFLDQMLSSLPSGTWLPSDVSSGHNPNNMSSTFDDQSLMLASKLRQHQINGGGGGAISPAARALMLQQQLLGARGLGSGLRSPTDTSGAGMSGLLPPSLGSGDDVEGSSFESPNPEALYNGFDGSLHGLSQTDNQAQHFQHPQGQAQNYGAPVEKINQAPANGGTLAQPRQRVRARRGQATDPHSIAERLRRERIAERMKGLQELVPNANKTDKASMLDEIIEYVKFLQLQVKVLSMSRLGGAASVVPHISSEGGGDCTQANGGVGGGGGRRRENPNGTQTAASSSNNNNNNDSLTVTEQQVVKLMEQDMGSAMQYLQGKGLCLMPISLASAISTTATRSHLNNNPLRPAGPTSPSLSGLTVQSATMGNTSGKDANSVSKP